jgi:hypothetical protein
MGRGDDSEDSCSRGDQEEREEENKEYKKRETEKDETERKINGTERERGW